MHQFLKGLHLGTSKPAVQSSSSLRDLKPVNQVKQRSEFVRRGYIGPINNKKPTKLIGHDDQYHYYAYKFVTTNTEEIIFTVPSTKKLYKAIKVN